MPLYDFECTNPDCDQVFEALAKYEEREKIRCKVCGDTTLCLVGNGRYIPFHSGWYEHLGPDPIYIKNKQQLRQVCKDNGKGSRYLDDM